MNDLLPLAVLVLLVSALLQWCAWIWERLPPLDIPQKLVLIILFGLCGWFLLATIDDSELWALVAPITDLVTRTFRYMQGWANAHPMVGILLYAAIPFILLWGDPNE